MQHPRKVDRAERSRWRPGVRARLLAAFLVIAGFAALAAAAGLFAFREVGDRLQVIDAGLPQTVSALELSRSAERLIAAAPQLLAAREREGTDRLKAELAAETARLEATLATLKAGAPDALPLRRIEAIATALNGQLATLDGLVARRLVASDRLAARQTELFAISSAIGRLLDPWLEVTEIEIELQVDEGAGRGDSNLAELIAQRGVVEAAGQVASAAVDLLAEAAATTSADRLSVLAFQTGLALDRATRSGDELAPRLASLFDAQIDALRALTEGADAIVETRRSELALLREGERLVTDIAATSTELAAAVDRLGGDAKADIGEAIGDALGVQSASANILLAMAALSLVTSALIVWFYVGGNIVRRLGVLGDGMMAIAAGRLQTPVDSAGSDEIAEMARAVEVLRRNTAERDALLVEKAEAAERLEAEVKERTAELEQANAFKSRFLASASHDLRQPMHALNLFIAQLRVEPDPKVRERLVGRVEAASASMNELFDALLDMSKLDAGILVPEVETFPVARLLSRVETALAATAGDKGLELRVVPSAAWVRSDFILLERIVLNLASNAIRYTEAGGVVIGCRRRGRDVRIDVCDSGPGIAPDRRQAIFGEFVQLPEGGRGRAGGLGLGLAIVSGLTDLLDHRISVDSRIGHGSRFSVQVRRSQPIEPADDAEEAVSTAFDLLADRTVVVIDDDPMVLESMGGVLSQWGCRVIAVASAEAAVAAIKSGAETPDAIISDYKLARGRSGLEAIGTLHDALGRRIPSLLITGETAPERLRTATDSGYHVLSKPVAPMALRAMLQRLLAQAGLHPAIDFRRIRRHGARRRQGRPPK